MQGLLQALVFAGLVLGGDPLDEALEKARAAGEKTIREPDLLAHLRAIAGPECEGRDSPSAGLARAARYIEQRFRECGARPFGESFLRPFTREVFAPVPEECALSLSVDGAGSQEPRAFRFGADFVPLVACGGEARGPLCFLGFGIKAETEDYDDLGKADLAGRIALILEGEPRHARAFAGEELTRDATLWTKLQNLRERRLAGVLVARRPPSPEAFVKKGAPAALLESAAPDPTLAFRHTWATWAVEAMADPSELARDLPPALEVSLECASMLLGEDVGALASRMDRSAKPLRREPKPQRTVSLCSTTRKAPVPIDNVVGFVPGSDPALAQEYVVVGAHYDHVGVDDRGRIGLGADDNGSGTAALIEIGQALGGSPPRRSVVLAAFAAEEDGLVGSRSFCQHPPVPREALVAMVNMDMLGRGDAAEVAVLGIVQNPGLERVLERARDLSRTGVRRLVLRQGEDLFERSDHFSFHSIGVPVLFFFEGLPLDKNRDYHTWRDTIERLDLGKIENSARLVFNTVWLLANDAQRPARPPG